METEINQPPQKSWPPVGGWPLFLAWMAGGLVNLMMGQMGSFAILSRTIPGGQTTNVLLALPSLLGRGWQSWLLFSKRPVRFVLWTSLALLITHVLWMSAAGDLRALAYLSYLIPLMEVAILAGTRQRPWAWILAAVTGAVIQYGFGGVWNSVGPSHLIKWVNDITSAIGAPSWLGSTLVSGAFGGVWLITEALKAWVLAWKMPVRPALPSPA